jgi:membrane protease YdiL (CAAX protease family)
MSADALPSVDSKSSLRVWSIGVGQTAILFGGGALLLFAVTHGVIPALIERTTIEPILLWFGAAGLGVFLPLLLIGVALLRQEGVRLNSGSWCERLRFVRMTRADWLWTIVGVLAVAVLAAKSVLLMKIFFGFVNLQPSFLRLEPLAPDRYWILAVWLPFFLINIMGEEFLWHGVMLPRQEAAFGRWAWLANGLGWLGFHVAFGPSVLFVLWPTTLIIPYIVQRQGNTWIGVLIHSALNGGGFLAIAFGLL